MSQPLRLDDPLPSVPATPSADRWRALSDAARLDFILAATDALNRAAELAPEGAPHIRAKHGVRAVLGDFFARIGRDAYLGTGLPVLYPGEPVFAPDLIAVLDVPDPGWADERMAWVVADEGRGVDFALEILHRGDRHKDLVDNVLFYARLQIPEYFVYDRAKQRVIGYRLPASGAARYEPVPSHAGVLSSRALGLELMVHEGRLRFLQPGGAAIPETTELLERVTGMVGELEERADAEAAARAEAERRAEEQARRADAEAAARAALEAKLAELLARSEG